MKIETAEREFRYNGVKLKDPNPADSLEKVREFYSAIYPEIISAAIEGPENIGNKLVYDFRKAVGTKGAADKNTIADKARAKLARETGSDHPVIDAKRHGKLWRAIQSATWQHRRHWAAQELRQQPLPHALPLLA